jgi:hypothetical protein
MLNKSSIFMMLLIVAASLIGIGSAAYHQPPEVAVSQPQQQPQQQQPQLQSPNTAPSIIEKRALPGSELQKESKFSTLIQISQDKLLVNRLFPYIIDKIDSKTLLQKIDAKTLAAKLLPHIRVKLGGAIHTSELIKVQKGALDPDTYHHVYAQCAPGEVLFSGGGHVRDRYLNDWRRSPEDNWLVETGIAETGNQWKITAKMSSSGDIYAEAICRKIALELVP